MQVLRGCRRVLHFAAQNKTKFYRLGALFLVIVAATTAWAVAIAVASHALGVHAKALLLAGLGLVVAALGVAAAAAMVGDD